LKDSGKVDKKIIEPILKEAIELSNILAASILTMKNRKKI